MTALQQALRVDANVVTEATGASRFFQLCESRLYGLPQRRPVRPLHHELPAHATAHAERGGGDRAQYLEVCGTRARDRKSTRLNSSHLVISYAVFCLKKKK